MNWKFLVFLFSVATFILNLPELVDKIGKFLPFLATINSLIDEATRDCVAVLPTPDPNLGYFGLLFFWPNIVVIIIAAILLLLFLSIAKRITTAKSLTGAPGFLTMLIGILICLNMSQIWLLHRTSNLSLWESAKIWSYPGKFAAATDKAYFLHGANVYGFVIYIVGFVLYFSIAWLWQVYKAMDEKG
jgi:hypothetical protein